MIDRIISLQKANRMTAKDLTVQLGINSTSVSEWKKGKIKPSIEVLIRISQIFNVSLDWLITGNKKDDVNDQKYRDLIFYFNELDEIDRAKIIERMQTLIEIKESSKPPKSNKKAPVYEDSEEDDGNIIEMKVMTLACSAGLGNYMDQADEYEMMEFNREEVPSKADFGVRISGDSMEPLIGDGQIVWLEQKPRIEDGEIGIFILDGEALCKKIVVETNPRVVKLVSLNDKYAPLVVKEHQCLQTCGKVLF